MNRDPEVKKKYELLKDNFIEWYGVKLYRIKACRDFGSVREGELGGYIEKEENLSHEEDCWVYDDAKVWENARVWENAKICDNAEVYANSEVFGNAVVRGDALIDGARIFGNALVRDKAHIIGNVLIYGNAEVFEYALIRDHASVSDNVRVYGKTSILDFAQISGNAEVFGFARVYGSAKISDRARIYDEARVGGNTCIGGNAEVYGRALIEYGLLTQDIEKDLVQYIACSLNIYPVNGKYILYKRVNKKAPGVYVSLYDPHFEYHDGEYVEAENPDMNFRESWGEGIHVSTPFYWQDGDTLIAVEVDINDVITCMDGKLRCRKVKVIGEV